MIKKLKILHSPRSKVTKLLRNAMPVQHIGQPLTVLESVDSSNNYAMGRVHARLASHGEAFFAQEQTAGKGQRGRQWVTRPGENIMVSIVLDCAKLNPNAPFMLSMAMALACSDWFSSLAGDEVSLKWPNDLYWRDRKAGGILIENLWSGSNWQFAIVGIGININQVEFDPMAKKPVSLKQITGKNFDLMHCLADLFQALEKRWQQLMAARSDQILEDYNNILFMRGMIARIRKDSAIFETTIMGVTRYGELFTKDTLERSFAVGEIDWV